MIDINKLKDSKYFESQVLKAGDILFDEGDKDSFLYIIEDGELSIEKYTSNKKEETKQLALLTTGDVFGEGSLSNQDPKQVKIIATKDTKLLKINGEKDFENFLAENPNLGIKLLSNIINVSNKRLLESNFIVTSSYIIIKFISEISKFDNKNLFTIIDKLLEVFNSDYIIYIEKNRVIDNAYILRYDTRDKGKMQEKITELQSYSENEVLPKFGIIDEKSKIYLEKLKNGNEIIGFLLFGTNEKFDDTQKKSLTTIAVSIAGFVKQKQYYEEKKDIDYLEI